MAWGARRACSPICAGAANAISVSIRFLHERGGRLRNGAMSGRKSRIGRPDARLAVFKTTSSHERRSTLEYLEISGHAASVNTQPATDACGTQSDPVLALIQPDGFQDLNLHPDTATEE